VAVAVVVVVEAEGERCDLGVVTQAALQVVVMQVTQVLVMQVVMHLVLRIIGQEAEAAAVAAALIVPALPP